MEILKRLLIAATLLVLPSSAFAGIASEMHAIGPSSSMVAQGATFTLGYFFDASTEKLGISYVASTTAAITAIDAYVTVTGNPGPWHAGVFTSSSGLPSSTQLGGYTADTDVASTGWSGAIALSTGTGALTVGTTYWIVFEPVSGTWDGSNYIKLSGAFNSTIGGGMALTRQYNGTNWTGAGAAVTATPMMALVHGATVNDGGFPRADGARTAQTDIYVASGTVKTQGVRWKYPAQHVVRSCSVYLTKTGTPSDLTLTLYEGDTAKTSISVQVAAVTTGGSMHFEFSPTTLAANTYCYILLTQTGASDSNDYDVWTSAIPAGYEDMTMPTDWAFVYGDGTTPSALTATRNELPIMNVYALDPMDDITAGSSSGGVSRSRLVNGGGD